MQFQVESEFISPSSASAFREQLQKTCEEARKMNAAKTAEPQQPKPAAVAAVASGEPLHAPSPQTVPETLSGPPSGDTSATQSSDDQSPPQVSYLLAKQV